MTVGTVTGAQRLDKPSNMHWQITARPDSNGDVTIVLPVTEDYDGTAASTRQALLSGNDRLTHTIIGLTNGTEYTVRVVACNEVGDGPASTEVTASPEAPNVLVILVDDLGYADVGFNGATDIQTPNLDELAAVGVSAIHRVGRPARARHGGIVSGTFPMCDRTVRGRVIAGLHAAWRR